MHSKNLILVLGRLAQLIAAKEATRAPRLETSSLLRRDGTPTASCPEQFGNPPMNCDTPACGGQSGTAGVCKNKSGSGEPCRCQTGTTGAPAPTNTRVTATNSAGSTIVGIYDLITIDKYKSLRQQETVTMSQTTTGSDGKPTVAAVAAVIAAGGVAWILGTSADAAGAAILNPPQPPQSNRDDPKCPAQKHKCKDCGALPGINICVAPDGGCGCESEDKCPSEDKKPKCSDTSCTGLNGKCTIGEHNGCSCRSCPTGDQQPRCDNEEKCKGKDGKCTIGEHNGCSCRSCPEPRYTPFCEVCGGKGDDGKCKGIANEKNSWKGCKCLDFANIEQPPQAPLDPSDDTKDLPNATPSSYSYSGDRQLICLNLPHGAKRDDIKKSVTDWCKSVNGKKVTKTGDTDVRYKRFSYDYYSYWLGAQYDGAGGNCGDSADVHEINCVSTMLKELDDCNPGDPEFKGAVLTDRCVKYHISLSRSTNDNDPPFKPLPQNSPECAKSIDDVSDVTFKFWEGVSKKFCNDVGDGKSAKKADLKNTDLQTRSIFRRTPPPKSSSYPDWKFHFEWEPKGSGFCTKTCEQAMAAFTVSCGHDGQQLNAMVKKGSIDVGCGKYSYSLEGPPKPPVAARATCELVHEWGAPIFKVRYIRGWANDGAEAFKQKVLGCGPEGGWNIYDHGSWKDISFYIPEPLPIDCVERAIKSAGGPEISCSTAQL